MTLDGASGAGWFCGVLHAVGMCGMMLWVAGLCSMTWDGAKWCW